MQDGSLGNKMNPWLAGLTGLGEGLFQGFLTRRKMDEEQRQFNERMAMEERQNSLLMDFRQRDFEQRQEYQDMLIKNIEVDNARAAETLKRPPREKNPVIKTSINPYTNLPGYFDVSNNEWIKDDAGQYLIAREETGGLTPYQQEMQDRYNEKKEEKRSAGQTYYNERLDLPYYSNEELVKLDPTIKPNPKGKGAFVKKIAEDEYEIFYSAKSLESAAKKELIQKKLYTKGLNFWKKKDPSEGKINSKIKPY